MGIFKVDANMEIQIRGAEIYIPDEVVAKGKRAVSDYAIGYLYDLAHEHIPGVHDVDFEGSVDVTSAEDDELVENQESVKQLRLTEEDDYDEDEDGDESMYTYLLKRFEKEIIEDVTLEDLKAVAKWLADCYDNEGMEVSELEDMDSGEFADDVTAICDAADDRETANLLIKLFGYPGYYDEDDLEEDYNANGELQIPSLERVKELNDIQVGDEELTDLIDSNYKALENALNQIKNDSSKAVKLYYNNMASRATIYIRSVDGKFKILVTEDEDADGSYDYQQGLDKFVTETILFIDLEMVKIDDIDDENILVKY